MACSRCGGYDSCHCDLLDMKKELHTKELECENLRYKIEAREKEYLEKFKERLL